MIDISSPARLSINLRRLLIEQAGEPQTAVPLDDIAAVVISHENVLFTHAVVSGLAGANAIFVVCDRKHLPVGMVLPLQTHHVQREVFALQAAMKVPVRKKLWRQIVQAKVRAQGALLKSVTGSAFGFDALAREVRSGDPTNVEGQAARRYWSRLFGREFRRDADGGDLNVHLNYGYAVLRGIVSRSICAAGLHPSLSLHHHNRYDSFALADDLMEPFRPVVDSVVWRLNNKATLGGQLSKEHKKELIGSLAGAYAYRRGEFRTLFDITARVASSLAQIARGQLQRLQLPTCWEFEVRRL
jgi:CRISPR-associated protein Cas1